MLPSRQRVWARGEERLRAAGVPVDEARLEAEVLLRHAADLTREELLTWPDEPLPPGAVRAYAALIGRRASGCPAAYLVGRREFFGIEFLVDDRVLIPRPETERLVEVAADALRGRPAPLAIDIGTGSGAIAIALAHLVPTLRVVATDISAGALEVARQNAARAGVAERIMWAEGEDLGPLEGLVRPGSADAVVSNPPYIPTAQVARLPVEIRAHEPRAALDGGPDGLAVHRRIVTGAARYLNERGVLALEVAALDGQARAVAALVVEAGAYTAPDVVRDYAGAERVVRAKRRGDDDADSRG